MRTFILKTHLYVGFVAGLFVMILGLTGSLMAFEPEIDQALHSHLFRISEQAGTFLSFDVLSRIAKEKFPDSEVVGFGLPDGPGKSSEVYLNSGEAVFVNQYSGEVLGILSGEDFLSVVHQTHIRLLAGNTGKTIMSFAGIGMFILVVSGILLWWRNKKATFRWGGPFFQTMFDLHNASGIYAAVFLFLLSTTGIFIAYDSAVLPWLYEMTGTQPSKRSGESTPREGVPVLSPEKALEIAKAVLPGAVPFMMELPGDSTGSYNFRFRFEEDLTPGGRSWVSIDQYSGAILALQNSRTAPGPTRAQILNRAIHTGDVFGTPSKIIMSFCSFLVVIQGISGISIWWLRDRKKRARNPTEEIKPASRGTTLQ